MAPRFNLHIDLGNAAMRTQRDIGRSLVELGQSMIEMGDGTLMDMFRADMKQAGV